MYIYKYNVIPVTKVRQFKIFCNRRNQYSFSKTKQKNQFHKIKQQNIPFMNTISMLQFYLYDNNKYLCDSHIQTYADNQYQNMYIHKT